MEERESAFDERIYTYAIVNNKHINIDDFFDDAFKTFDAKQTSIIADRYIVKTYASFVGDFINSAGVKELLHARLYINCDAQLMDLDTDLHVWYIDIIFKHVKVRIEDLELNGSGWILASIVELVIFDNVWEPLRGSSFIQLSTAIARKKAVINVQNADERCFEWALLVVMQVSSCNQSTEGPVVSAAPGKA